jgi:hypothetical protein
VKKPNTSRGLGEKISRHKRYANHYRVLQGSKCKTAITSSPTSALRPAADRGIGRLIPAPWVVSGSVEA